MSTMPIKSNGDACGRVKERRSAEEGGNSLREDNKKNLFYKRSLKIKRFISPSQILEKKMQNISLKVYHSNQNNRYIPVLPNCLSVSKQTSNRLSPISGSSTDYANPQEYQIKWDPRIQEPTHRTHALQKTNQKQNKCLRLDYAFFFFYLFFQADSPDLG